LYVGFIFSRTEHNPPPHQSRNRGLSSPAPSKLLFALFRALLFPLFFFFFVLVLFFFFLVQTICQSFFFWMVDLSPPHPSSLRSYTSLQPFPSYLEGRLFVFNNQSHNFPLPFSLLPCFSLFKMFGNISYPFPIPLWVPYNRG